MSSRLRSMTGFARVHRSTPQGEIVVSLKSVNHRGLDLHFHQSPELDAFENAMRATLKRSLGRGHVDIRVHIASDANTTAWALNEDLLQGYITAFRKAAARHGIENAEPDLNAALRMPGMLSVPEQTEAERSLESELIAALEQAVKDLNGFREREGSEVGDVLREHNQSILGHAKEMEQIRSRALPLFQRRMEERIRELLNSNLSDPGRISQEAAMIADRSDIGEEISRLIIHSGQIDTLLENGGEVGKKLDFLLQEMNREANTILSKTSGIGELGLRITDLGLAAKASIERLRELALNLE